MFSFSFKYKKLLIFLIILIISLTILTLEKITNNYLNFGDSKIDQREKKMDIYPNLTQEEIDSTSNWKIFKNVSGWSIKYPPEWHVGGCCYKTVEELSNEPKAFVGFYPPTTPDNSNEGWLMVEYKTDKLRNVDLWDWFKDISSSGPPTVKGERIMFNGRQAFKEIWRGCSNICNVSPQSEYYGPWQEDIYVVYDDIETFELEFNTDIVYKKITDYKNYKTYQQIVNTFRFDDKF
jgi:hypothetical protein